MSTRLPIQVIRWMYPENDGSGFTIVPKPGILDPILEKYFSELATRLKHFDTMINAVLPSLLHGHLKDRLYRARQLHLKFKNQYINEIDSYFKLLSSNPNSPVNQKLLYELEIRVDNYLNDLSQILQDLELKARFVSHLTKQNFQYCNVAQYDLHNDNSPQKLVPLLSKDKKPADILCSNDTVNDSNLTKLNQLCSEMATRRQINRSLRLIYADFSYCPTVLNDMMIISSREQINEPITPQLPIEHPISSERPESDEDFINILLIGETGVGKSTFINALINYLAFDSLLQAQSNQPMVLIPVSFLITTGDHFQEHTVKFGKLDDSSSENFNHPGQSVTQHCRSYLFTLSQPEGKKLCIIDTPGFGDTRGLGQDNMNMKHISEYLSNLNHLNAICFLLKPNESRLHIFLRTCLSQLLNLFGSNARQNLIFCFTNARSTFYTPGNTAPLLRTMLDSLHIQDIPFKKENTFCFDNESFRYLVALQNGIQFTDEEQKEYEMSWSNSSTESNRLVNYIITDLPRYSLRREQQSMKHTQIEITHVVRPILETIRNILRNKVLREIVSPNSSIVLRPQTLHRSRKFCTACKRNPLQLSNFWILPDITHEFTNKCLECTCDYNQHISIDYTLEYDISNDPSFYQQNEMDTLLHRLKIESVDFAYFLMNVTHSTEDPFLVGLLSIIDEEKQICAEQRPNDLNLQLVQELEQFVTRYREQKEKTKLDEDYKDIDFISRRIKSISKCSMVREQMEAIHQKRKEN